MKLVANVYSMAESVKLEVDTDTNKVLVNSVPKNANATKLFVKLFRRIKAWPRKNYANPVMDAETFSVEVTVGKKYKKVEGQAHNVEDYNKFRELIEESKLC